MSFIELIDYSKSILGTFDDFLDSAVLFFKTPIEIGDFTFTPLEMLAAGFFTYVVIRILASILS